MKLALGNDHAGVHLKRYVKEQLLKEGHEVLDLGPDSEESVDYPIYTFKVTDAVVHGEAELGIFICGSGTGPVIAANKVKGIRAVTSHDVYTARSSRRDNDANMLTMGERVIGPGLAMEVIKAWLAEPFSHAERHQRRIDEITEAEA